MRYLPPNVSGALISLRPEAAFSIDISGNVDADYESVDWLSSDPMPSLADVKAEIDRIQNEELTEAEWIAATEYQRLRAPEYPGIGEQLDALFHAGVFPAEMEAKIAAVKEKYPKPDEVA